MAPTPESVESAFEAAAAALPTLDTDVAAGQRQQLLQDERAAEKALGELHPTHPLPVVEERYALLACEVSSAKLLRRVKAREYFVVVSLGTQHYSTPSARSKGTPEWNSSHNLIVQQGAPATVRFAVFCHARVNGVHKRLAVGVTELDLSGSASSLPFAANAEGGGGSNVGRGGGGTGSAGGAGAGAAAGGTGGGAGGGFSFSGPLQLRKPAGKPSSARAVPGCAGGVAGGGGGSAGELAVSVRLGSVSGLAQSVWSRVMALGDLDHDGKLSCEDFVDLMVELGCSLPQDELRALFEEADTSGSGCVSEGELSALLTSYHGRGQLCQLMGRCFVCGAELPPADGDSALVHVSLCMDEGTGQSLQGATSSNEQRLALALKLSEWTAKPSAACNKRSGSFGSRLVAMPRTALKTTTMAVRSSVVATVGTANKTLRMVSNRVTTVGRKSPKPAVATTSFVPFDPSVSEQSMTVIEEEATSGSVSASVSTGYTTSISSGARLTARQVHPVLYVYNRHSRALEEEVTPAYILMAMRELYMNPLGRSTLRSGGNKVLRDMSVRQGRWADSTESAKNIPKFIDSYKGQLVVDEIRDPLDSFKTFNEFFYRKLKPESRPIAAPGNHEVVVSSADCRLHVFESVDAATRFWIKGRRFSVSGLLGDAQAAKRFEGGSMAIFRLAPQDYHRFHFPVAGTVKSILPIPGKLYTVNPIAIRSKMDVFTANKRSCLLMSNPLLGDVAFVAIGATVVGGICFTGELGLSYTKGEDMGYFKFGGSTCILLFPPGVVTWDSDLLVNSRQSLETLVRMGERIGVKAGSTLLETESFRRSTEAELKGLESVLPLRMRMSLLEEEAQALSSLTPRQQGKFFSQQQHMAQEQMAQAHHHAATGATIGRSSLSSSSAVGGAAAVGSSSVGSAAAAAAVAVVADGGSGGGGEGELEAEAAGLSASASGGNLVDSKTEQGSPLASADEDSASMDGEEDDEELDDDEEEEGDEEEDDDEGEWLGDGGAGELGPELLSRLSLTGVAGVPEDIRRGNHGNETVWQA